MNSKEERGKSRRQVAHNDAGNLCRDLQQTQAKEIREHRVGRMKENIGQMIAKRLHAPQPIIQAKCNPAERLIMTQMEGRKHPAQMSPGKVSEVLVLNDRFKVVPIHEAIS